MWSAGYYHLWGYGYPGAVGFGPCRDQILTVETLLQRAARQAALGRQASRRTRKAWMGSKDLVTQAVKEMKKEGLLARPPK
jgi:hypothetical protein